ncbi:peptide-methionine (S)-S-oxide reductase MsrA [Aureispira sp. CCB-QB1]|uniref:peptide-methionine (S)-S-oxide reductase MsrA n=1 Tax=Aureispira sp. CCB-QB1 TaxID=1313421 RepID=UPI0006971CD2|nr:peptide-methionine (S)-S-oxide reductase MsrA [Aureispira sp. CCB-QB1]
MRYILSVITISLFFFSCSSNRAGEKTVTPEVEPQTVATKNTASTKKMEELSKAYFASGCFWCVEAVFESVRGVEEVISGYAGGTKANPTYEEVGSGQTDHAEAVEVYYDPEIVSYATLLKVYYGAHDPTTVNGQHPDFGKQYRSMILYNDEMERKAATDFKAELEAAGTYSAPIATEIVPFKKFWPAEDYHQDYEKRNPNNSYVRNVSIPRLNRFKEKFPELLKKGH